MKRLGSFIDGKLYLDNNLEIIEVYNPSEGKVSKHLECADLNILNKAIESSVIAFDSWSNTPISKRVEIMFKFRELLKNNIEELANLIGQEHGKIIHDAKGEILRGIENVEFACSAPNILKGEFTKNISTNIDTWSLNEPVGIVSGITPFNFPAMVPLWMFPLAIVCGNTFILKPSERDPSASLFIANLLKDAGLPDGVLNVVNGGKEIVQCILKDSRISAISFVGSTFVAEYVYQESCRYGKRCQALGGAKNHAIVMPDANMDNVINSLIGAAFGSSGQRCMALSVAIAIGDKVADELIANLKLAISNIKIGPYNDNNCNYGAVITKSHKDKVISYINSAKDQGAKIVVDGTDINISGYEDGFYVGATLIDNVNINMDSYKAEIFGPILQIIRANNLDAAIDIINNHEYGNGTCIYTNDGYSSRYFINNIKVGMVGVNIPLPVPVASYSFGGWKRSLFGDLHMYGTDGVRFYTKKKVITQKWVEASSKEKVLFSMPSNK